MHTETNVQDAREAPGWLWRQWHNVQLMRQSGVPVLGFTWYSLIDQVDWNIGLTRALGNVNPVGLYDLNREPREVAQAYQQLLKMFGNESLVPNTPDVTLDQLLDQAEERDDAIHARPRISAGANPTAGNGGIAQRRNR
jgi:hypothetical protein